MAGATEQAGRSQSRSARPAPSRASAQALADELLRELSAHIADPDAVGAVMLRWLDEHGGQQLGHITALALQSVFATCLNWTAPEDVPARAVAFRPDDISQTAGHRDSE